MDFDHNTPETPPIPVPQQGGPASLSGIAVPPPPRKRGGGWAVLFGILFLLSAIVNGVLVMVVISVVAVLGSGPRMMLEEATIEAGPASKKIAVVSITGIIAGQQSSHFKNQIEAAARDKRVKAVIVRVNSPGGTISGSDQIYNEILNFREETEKPIIAFMEGVAASGGYYTSVACDKIIAEPTAITGSIGVIGQYFVFQELLEEKLGILPVVVKSGKRKDWPSSFQAPTQEQLTYMQDRLIKPAFERFVKIIVDSRKDKLDEDTVRRLADGSIYTADLALEEKLIDQVGYFDDAVEEAKSMAHIKDARVVEYRRPFTMSSLFQLRSPNAVKIDKSLLHELSTPELLYLYSTQ